MNVKVTVHFAGRSTRTFVVGSNYVWMTDGFLHIKEGNITYSFSNMIVEEVIQERLNESG